MGDKIFKGVIIKGVGGFYYVDTADGCFECRARGSFRKDSVTPLVGDKVEISVDGVSGTGSVDKIFERKNVLLRPPVANVTQMAAVISVANPKPNFYLTDKLLASAELADIKILVCINKTDIENADALCSLYEDAGFCVIPLCATKGENVDLLKEKLKDNVTVFAGNSGVGKSSILNSVTESDEFKTGEVSERVERGKHTTRHSELVALKSGGYIIDTPGFGTLDFSLLDFDSPANLFRDFHPYIHDCRFSDCSHTVEAGCAVLDAVADNKISVSRHESYKRLVEEIRNAGKRNRR